MEAHLYENQEEQGPPTPNRALTVHLTGSLIYIPGNG